MTKFLIQHVAVLGLCFLYAWIAVAVTVWALNSLPVFGSVIVITLVLLVALSLGCFSAVIIFDEE